MAGFHAYLTKPVDVTEDQNIIRYAWNLTQTPKQGNMSNWRKSSKTAI